MSGLIETYRGVIYPWHCDHMGHMNVMWYVGKFDEATWNLFAAMGGEISAICVLTGVSIDAQTRKSCPFPQDLLERAQALVREYAVPS
jgi:acyl-CoA thioesterase FadM